MQHDSPTLFEAVPSPRRRTTRRLIPKTRRVLSKTEKRLEKGPDLGRVGRVSLSVLRFSRCLSRVLSSPITKSRTSFVLSEPRIARLSISHLRNLALLIYLPSRFASATSSKSLSSSPSSSSQGNIVSVLRDKRGKGGHRLAYVSD